MWQGSVVIAQCNHPDDYTALRALYLATDGDNWNRRDGWPSRIEFLTNPSPPAGTNMSGWHGIQCGSSIQKIEDIILIGNQLSGLIPSELGNLTNLVDLNFSANQLSGLIPLELGNLTNLKYLRLGSNLLSGQIPIELSNLSNLTVFYLSGNKLSGSIPSEIGKLSNLTAINFSQNQLSGTIPTEIGKLSNLVDLAFWGNQLSGSIPAEIGNLSNLIALRLGGNQLSGTIPAEIGKLSNLKDLSLSENQLSGTIPSELSNLLNLEYLGLRKNKLSGEIPTSLGNLSKLFGLSLGNNQLTGGIPNQFSNFQDNISIDINNNQLSGCFPSSLHKFCNRISIYSGDNHLLPWQGNFSQFCATDGSQQAQIGAYCDNGNPTDGTNDEIQDDCSCGLLPPCNHPDFAPLMAFYNSMDGPNWINNSGWKEGAASNNCNPCNGWYGVTCNQNNRVNGISLTKNKLNGQLPNEIGQILFLEVLHLGNNVPFPVNVNNVYGEIPSSIENLKDMSYIDLQRNKISGTFPFALTKLTKLTALFLSENEISGSLPKEIGNLNLLQYLRLSRNKLSSNLPLELGLLLNLRELSLGENQFIGSIPKEFGNLALLNYLILGGNQISGEIPIEILNLTNLENLILNNNKLTGTIPLMIGNLTKLKALWLQNNQFNGTIPIEIGNLLELDQMFLNSNQLTGKIPSEIGNLTKLKTLVLSNNLLNGLIPEEIGNSVGLDFLDLGYNELTGYLPKNLTNLDQLNILYLNNNNLEGCIDQIFQVFCNKTVEFYNNPLLPWQGDFTQFCSTDGSQQAQIGAPCDNGNPADGTNDVIDQNCNCVPCPTSFATINGDVGICEGSSTEFTATGGTSYLWTTGQTTDKITVAAAGSYSVTVTNAFGCTSENTKTLAVYNAPTATITGIDTVCAGESATFAAAGGISYLWSNGATTANITVNTAGTYSVTVTDAARCEAKRETMLTVNAKPSATINGANEICEGSNTELTATGGAGYVWNTTATTDKITVNTAGIYTVTITDGNGCTSIINKALAVNNVPIATINGANEICEGSNTEFTATGGISYLWNTSETTDKITVNTAARYSVTVTDAIGCMAEFSKTLSVYIAPIVNISGDNEICEGESKILTASGGSSYVWNTGATTNTIQINSSGIYTVSVTNNNGCVGSTSFGVTLLDDTTLSQTKNDTLYVNKGNNYQVDLLQNDILFTDSIKVQLVNIPQAFIRVLSFDEKGRISLEVKEAFIETLEIGYEVCDPCNPCVSGKLIILNEKLKEITQTTLITPSQSTNKTLQFSSEPIPDSELWIYNRWGQQILHSKNYQNDWDANGYPGGVYYYVFKVYGFTIKRALTVVK